MRNRSAMSLKTTTRSSFKWLQLNAILAPERRDAATHSAGWRQRLKPILNSKTFHLSIIYLVLFDIALVVIDLILSLFSSCLPDEEGHCASQLQANSPGLQTAMSFLYWLSLCILLIFFIEVCLSTAVFGRQHLMNPIVAFDSSIIISSIITEIYFHFSGLEGSGSNAAIILRILKLIRGMHAVAHAAAYQARLRVQELEQLNERIASRARIMMDALSEANSKMEALLASVVPSDDSKSSEEVRRDVKEMYNHLKRVVRMAKAGLEGEVGALIAREESDEIDEAGVEYEATDIKKEFHLA
ncbi:hypothetical protein BC830DRAFT_1149560 [Chytriomyces sp. MP71]|nr:hypothetical protein BC830DRAFT_1149560 [Chytriomyces sp. MP71]